MTSQVEEATHLIFTRSVSLRSNSLWPILFNNLSAYGVVRRRYAERHSQRHPHTLVTHQVLVLSSTRRDKKTHIHRSDPFERIRPGVPNRRLALPILTRKEPQTNRVIMFTFDLPKLSLKSGEFCPRFFRNIQSPRIISFFSRTNSICLKTIAQI